jgi:hypothetical protein
MFMVSKRASEASDTSEMLNKYQSSSALTCQGIEDDKPDVEFPQTRDQFLLHCSCKNIVAAFIVTKSLVLGTMCTLGTSGDTLINSGQDVASLFAESVDLRNLPRHIVAQSKLLAVACPVNQRPYEKSGYSQVTFLV